MDIDTPDIYGEIYSVAKDIFYGVYTNQNFIMGFCLISFFNIIVMAFIKKGKAFYLPLHIFTLVSAFCFAYAVGYIYHKEGKQIFPSK